MIACLDPPNGFSIPQYVTSSTLLLTNYYNRSDGIEFLCPTHADAGFLTVVFSEPGLQIFDSETSKWIDTTSVPEADAIILFGDSIQQISGINTISTFHRVVNTHNYQSSVVFKLKPCPDAIVPWNTVDHKIHEIHKKYFHKNEISVNEVKYTEVLFILKKYLFPFLDFYVFGKFAVFKGM